MLIEAKAILFDMDGTLVHSTDDVETVWGHWCRLNDVPLNAVLEICHGVRSRDVVRRVAAHLDLEAQIHLLEKLEIELGSGANPISGAAALLEGLSPGSWAVVTSASRQVALHRLTQCGLPIPDVLIGSGDVESGKPHPEPYASAARRLLRLPSECVAFEDAKAGIQSALAAGCKVIQVGGGMALDAGVQAVIEDLRQIEVRGDAGDLIIRIGARSAPTRG
jgi:sugar-phosphatase